MIVRQINSQQGLTDRGTRTLQASSTILWHRTYVASALGENALDYGAGGVARD